MDFVIHVNGEAPGKGFWVLHIDAVGGRFLLAGENGVFRWVNMSECVFIRGANPDIPRPVVVVEPRQEGVAVPQLRLRNGLK